MPYNGLIAETVNMIGHEGDQIDAYLARPLGSGPFPGVVLIHHMPGWDDASREMARKLAYNGYACISPNLHFREGQATSQANSDSVRAAGGMPDARTMGDVAGAISVLRSLPYHNGKVGIIGFCSGGRQVYLAAATLDGIDAAVNCWGGGINQVPETEPERSRQPVAPIDYTSGISCPMLGLFGNEDARPSPATWTRWRPPSSSTARSTSSTATTTPDTASSPSTVPATASTPPSTDGRRSSSSTAATSAPRSAKPPA